MSIYLAEELPAAQATAVAGRCLDLLSAEDMSDEFYEAVDLLRPSRARALDCQSCDRTVGFLALFPWENRVVTVTLAPLRVPPKRRRGGAFDLRYQSNLKGGWMLDGVAADASHGHRRIVSSPDGSWGDTWQRRWTLQCECGAKPVLTNDALVAQYLRAIASGNGKIRI